MKSEKRLDEIRAEAERTGSVAAKGVRASGAPLPIASAETGYYELPLLKPPVWTWEVPTYFFVGGAAGAAAVVAFVARATGSDERLVRDARWIAAIGANLSAPLLISDLGRPERFLNMLRVFKPKSPMSVGAWIVAAFGGAATATIILPRRLADVTSFFAAIAGLGMASYTGVLLGVSSIPAWSEHAKVLPMHFTASSTGAAVSLLELRGHNERALNTLGFAAAAFETVAGGKVAKFGSLLSGPMPFVLRLLGRRKAAAAAAVIGSLITRMEWIEEGRKSAAGHAATTQRVRDNRSQNDSRDGSAASAKPMPPVSSEK